MIDPFSEFERYLSMRQKLPLTMREKYLRREYMILATTGAAAGVAGCLSGSGNSDENGSGGNNGGDGNNSSGGGNTSGGNGSGDNGSTVESSWENASELPPAHWLSDYNNDAWEQQWDSLTSSFTDETGIATNIEFVGGSGTGEQRLANLIQAGDAPDMITTTTESVIDLRSQDQLQPVNDVIDSITPVAGESVVNMEKDGDGNLYQVPHGYYVSTYLYREDIYEALDLSEPSSFDEVLENARIIDESDEFDARGFALPAAQNAPLADGIFRQFYANMGYARVRWKSDAEEEVELWFPKEPAVELLNFFKELAQYSPDPSQVSFTSVLSNWGAGAYAQTNHLNLWPGGVAAGIDPEIAKNTGATNVPLDEGVSKAKVPVTLQPDGHFILKPGANTPGSKRLLEWLYGRDIETTAGMYGQEPMRFLPSYSKILETDTFADFEIFQEFPGHLEKLQKIENIGNEFFGNNKANQRALHTGAGYYLRGVFFYGNMLNDVVVVGKDPETAYDETRAQMEERLEEGKSRFG